MQKNILRLPDKTEVASGEEAVSIMSFEHYEETNSGSELKVGSAVASYITATIATPQNQFIIPYGTEMEYWVEEDGIRKKIGLYTVESPKRTGRNTFKVTAFDRMIWFDQDITWWIESMNFGGETLLGLLRNLCDMVIKIRLANDSIPNGDYELDDFKGEMTGRQLLEYIAAVAGCFARITVDGDLELAWYEEINQDNYQISLKPESEAPVELADGAELYTSDGLQFVALKPRPYYFLNSLTFEDYTVAPIERLQIRNNADEIGIIHPPDLKTGNTYIIEKNPLLANLDPMRLSLVAQTIFERIQPVVYTPAKVSIPATWQVRAGDSVSIEDINGRVFYTLAMSCRRRGQKLTIQSQGSQNRSSATAVNQLDQKQIAEKLNQANAEINALRKQSNQASQPVTDSISATLSSGGKFIAVTGIETEGNLVKGVTKTEFAMKKPTIEEIGAAPAGFGLGERAFNAPENDANQITKCGFFRAYINTPTGDWWTIQQEDLYGDGKYMIQKASCYAYTHTLHAERMVINSSFYEWEWVNPPMMDGTEYRTTERLNGKPVYAKLIRVQFPNGISASGTTVTENIAHNVENMDERWIHMAKTGNYPLPYAGTSMTLSRSNIILRVSNENWDSGYIFNFIIKYTKTTD